MDAIEEDYETLRAVLPAYGKGKSVVCMDGFDLSEMLKNYLSLSEVLSLKVRRAAETGQPFVQLRDLL